MEENERYTENIWFLQDYATALKARISTDIMRTTFSRSLVCRNGDVLWPLCSPDFAPCDFILWWYLKSKVNVNKPQILNDLYDLIRSEIASITEGMLEKVMTNFGERLHVRTLFVGYSVSH